MSLFSISFLVELTRLGLVLNEGKIVDAGFIEVHRQRNTKDQNDQIKKREIPANLSANSNVLAQKDTYVTWTKKNDQTFYAHKTI